MFLPSKTNPEFRTTTLLRNHGYIEFRYYPPARAAVIFQLLGGNKIGSAMGLKRLREKRVFLYGSVGNWLHTTLSLTRKPLTIQEKCTPTLLFFSVSLFHVNAQFWRPASPMREVHAGEE